jgi:hypothetical protein
MANLSAPATNVTDQTRLDFYRKALKAKQESEAADREAKAARGVYRAVLKDAKKAGVSTDSITFALAARHIDGDELLIEQRERMRMLAISGVMPTIQTDLFEGVGKKPDLSEEEAGKIAVDRAYDDGYFSGNNGVSRSLNKHFQGTEEFEAWERGWVAGQAKIITTLAPKAKVARTPRKGKQTGEEMQAAE